MRASFKQSRNKQMEKMKFIIRRIKDKQAKKKLEKFIYAKDWFESTQNLKSFDEVKQSLKEYYAYIDKQVEKVENYFDVREKSFGTKNFEAPNFYANFELNGDKKKTISKLENEKTLAHIYSTHYNSVLKNSNTKTSSNKAKTNAHSDICFGSKK